MNARLQNIANMCKGRCKGQRNVRNGQFETVSMLICHWQSLVKTCSSLAKQESLEEPSGLCLAFGTPTPGVMSGPRSKSRK